MATIAIVIDDMFEDCEYGKPVQAFMRAGHALVHIGVNAGRTVTGKQAEMAVDIDKTAQEARGDDYDALFIPGGYSPDSLRVHEAVVVFVRDFVNSGKPVFTICHAPQLLITADVLRGRTITGHQSVIQDIKNAGAAYKDEEVVMDGNLLSSRNPGDLPAFIKASLSKLESK